MISRITDKVLCISIGKSLKQTDMVLLRSGEVFPTFGWVPDPSLEKDLKRGGVISDDDRESFQSQNPKTSVGFSQNRRSCDSQCFHLFILSHCDLSLTETSKMRTPSVKDGPRIPKKSQNTLS